jgi:hypothetical protein
MMNLLAMQFEHGTRRVAFSLDVKPPPTWAVFLLVFAIGFLLGTHFRGL